MIQDGHSLRDFEIESFGVGSDQHQSLFQVVCFKAPCVMAEAFAMEAEMVSRRPLAEHQNDWRLGQSPDRV